MFGENIFNFVVHVLRIRLDGASMTVSATTANFNQYTLEIRREPTKSDFTCLYFVIAFERTNL